MKPKAIFLDIDGTLTEPGTNVPPASALEAIRRAQEAGNYVFLCTGRNYAMLSPLLKYGFDGVVASSGGYVACRDEVIYDSPMTDEERDRMSRLLKENGIFRTIECVEGAFTDDDFKNFLREHANEGENSEMLRWQEQIEKDLNILPMEAYKGQAVYKMVVMSPSMESLEICREELKDDFSFCIQEPRGGFVNGEIISRRFDKGTGVLKVCEHLGIPLEDSVGFGDSMNDKEMLEVAGLSVCMENGSAEMKKIADVICPSVTEDGIKKAFEKGKAFIPFITCGDPSLEVTEQLVYAMEEAGADLIELGIPFSDPTAEGPVIQAANIRALSGGVTTDKVFDMVEKIRKNSSIPMVFMTYANVVFSYGSERFVKKAAEVGMDGLILPDVPFEEKEEFDGVCKEYGLDLISLIAPTSHERISMIAKEAQGFVYCVSSLGVTGMRSPLTTHIGAMMDLV